MDFDEAWRIVGLGKGDNLEAFQVLAANRHRLPGFVFVDIPGGSEPDPEWTALAQPDDAIRPGCVTRRMMLPTELRLEIQPVDDTIVVDADHPLTVGPWGGDVQAALHMFRVEGGTLAVYVDPHSPMPFASHWVMRGRRPSMAMALTDLASMLAEQGPMTFGWGQQIQQVVGQIVVVDAAARTVGIQLDIAIQVVTDQTLHRHHVCDHD